MAVKLPWGNWFVPSSHRQVQKAPPTPSSLPCHGSLSSGPWVETSLVTLHPLCDPPFAICLARGAACHLSPACSPPPGLRAAPGLPQNNAGTPSGAQDRPLLCVAWRPLSLPAQPSPDGPVARPLWRMLKGGCRDRTVGDRRQDGPRDSLAVHAGLGTVSSTGRVLSSCVD